MEDKAVAGSEAVSGTTPVSDEPKRLPISKVGSKVQLRSRRRRTDFGLKANAVTQESWAALLESHRRVLDITRCEKLAIQTRSELVVCSLTGSWDAEAPTDALGRNVLIRPAFVAFFRVRKLRTGVDAVVWRVICRVYRFNNNPLLSRSVHGLVFCTGLSRYARSTIERVDSVSTGSRVGKLGNDSSRGFTAKCALRAFPTQAMHRSSREHCRDLPDEPGRYL